MSLLTKPKAEPRPPARPHATDAPPLSPPPKLRRNPLALALSVATIVLGAVVSLWLWTSAGTTAEVLAVRTLVNRGELIARDDLVVVRMGVDPAVQTVPADRVDAIVGQRAALDLAPGGLLAPDDLAVMVVPGKGSSVVGIALARGMWPAEPLFPGDAVRLVQTPGQQGEVDGVPVTIPAEVVGVHHAETSDQTVVDVLVPAEAAAEVAAHAATGKVALVLDARER